MSSLESDKNQGNIIIILEYEIWNIDRKESLNKKNTRVQGVIYIQPMLLYRKRNTHTYKAYVGS